MTNHKRFVFALASCLTLACASAAYCQLHHDWIHYYQYDASHSGVFKDVYQTEDGGFILAGDADTTQMVRWLYWLVKTSAEGEVEFNRIYDFRPGGHEECFSVIQCEDGGYMMAGRIHQDSSRYATLIKTDENGNLVWHNTYGGYSEFRAVIELKAGAYLACGRNDENGVQAYVVLVDNDGRVIWAREYAEGHVPEFWAVRETNDGYLFAGQGNAGWLVKTNTNGDIIWQRDYERCQFTSLISCRAGGFAVAGGWAGRFVVVRVNADGEIVWRRECPANDIARGLASTPDGGFLVVGTWPNSAEMLRLNMSGDSVWYHEGGFGIDRLYTLFSTIQSSDGQMYVCGEGIGEGGTAALVKITPDRLSPLIVSRRPTEQDLTVLLGDSIFFDVFAMDEQLDTIFYSWTHRGEVVSSDSFAVVHSDTLGEDTVKCVAFNRSGADSTWWHVSVRDFFIASHTPDSLNLRLRRGTYIDFEITAAAAGNDQIFYNWTLTEENNVGQIISDANVASIEFQRPGNYTLQALAYRDSLSDSLSWNIAVRSTVYDFHPEGRILSVPLDTTVIFGIMPFEPSDTTLRYLWLVDGDSVGADTAISYQFTEITGGQGRPPYLIEAIVSDSTDADTIVWNVTVVRPNSVANPAFQLSAFSFQLSPNPFNAHSTVHFSLPAAASGKLTLHDLTGRAVRTLAEGRFAAGEHQVALDAVELPAGLYFLRLEAAGKVKVVKAVVMK